MPERMLERIFEFGNPEGTGGGGARAVSEFQVKGG